MNFLNLIKNELGERRKQILFMIFLAGLTHSMVIVIINKAASLGEDKFERFRLFLLFLFFVTTYIYSKRWAIANFSSIIEDFVHKIRCQLVDRILSSPLSQLEPIGASEIYTILTRDLNNFSEAGRVVLGMMTSGVVVIVSFLMVATISQNAFLLTLFFLGLGVAYYLVIQKKAISLIGQSYAAEQTFFTHFHQGLYGFKEIKLNVLRERALYENELPFFAEKASHYKTQTMKQFSANLIFAQATILSLLGAQVFFSALYPDTSWLQVAQVLAIILYFFGPLSDVVGGLPYLSFADVSWRNLQQLQDRLSPSPMTSSSPAVSPIPEMNFDHFQQITLKNLVFSYGDQNQIFQFQVGPLNLTLRRGEIIFIIGGNGSGKSTLLKLLTGLYSPQEGQIFLNEMEIGPSQLETYHELFSLIMTDFHLFDRLYGLEEVDTHSLEQKLLQFRLEQKVQFAEKSFRQLDLSTGERKRLALIVAQLEDRPILILDEWAAEQDPRFRRFFYEDLLPQFKAQGKTVILVTHDDRYFSYADHLFKMEQGLLLKFEHVEHVEHDEKYDEQEDYDPLNSSPRKKDRKPRLSIKDPSPSTP